MSTEFTPAKNKASAWRAIGLGGLIGGAFDITFAIFYYGKSGAAAGKVLRSVAGGLIGRTAATEGGMATAALGLTLHFLIAFAWAAAYFLAAKKFPVLVKHALLSGLAFGGLIYFVMNMVVLPLSAYHSPLLPMTFPALPILGHLVGIGLPMALATRWQLR